MTAIYALAVVAAVGLASGAATMTNPAVGQPDPPPADSPRAQPHRPPIAGGMVTHSMSSPAVVVGGPGLPPPPIVAIPRRPGPAEILVPSGGSELRTLERFASIEDCDAALPRVRRQVPNAVCVSTAPPEPEPDHAELVELGPGDELVGLEFFPSMAACEQARAGRKAKSGGRTMCAKLEMH